MGDVQDHEEVHEIEDLVGLGADWAEGDEDEGAERDQCGKRDPAVPHLPRLLVGKLELRVGVSVSHKQQQPVKTTVAASGERTLDPPCTQRSTNTTRAVMR